MHGQFDSPVELPNDPDELIRISGPLLEVDPRADRATVHFLIVQGEGEDSVIVDGEGTWRKGPPETPWTGTVRRVGKRAGGGEGTLRAAPARGIAVAVAIKDGELLGSEFVPPSIETLTWCVNIAFTQGSAA
jgi:hypothetical protein